MRAKIAIVGLGGLGSIVATLLAKENIILIDKDYVDENNIKYHPLYFDKDLGKAKAEVLGKRLNKPYFVGDFREFDFRKVDLIVDCLDSWKERKGLFEMARELGKITIHGAVGNRRGQVAVIRESYDYFMKFEGEAHARDETPWIVGSYQAFFVKNYQKYIDKLLLIDLNKFQTVLLNLKRR